jgi:hypothetical protein
VRRQIIQTETKGWTPAMRRNAFAAVLMFVLLVLVMMFIVHHPGTHVTKSATSSLQFFLMVSVHVAPTSAFL